MDFDPPSFGFGFDKDYALFSVGKKKHMQKTMTHITSESQRVQDSSIHPELKF